MHKKINEISLIMLVTLVIVVLTLNNSVLNNSLLYVIIFLIIGLSLMIFYNEPLQEHLTKSRFNIENWVNDLKNDFNFNISKSKNKAEATLYKNNEIVEKYIALSGNSINNKTKKLSNYSKKNVHHILLPLSNNSPFIITERLSSDLNWINMIGLNSKKNEELQNHSFINNRSNNCTERKIIDAIYNKYKDKIELLSELDLIIHTEYEPCLYCYKLLKDIIERENPTIKFKSIKVTYEDMITEIENEKINF